MNTVKLIEQQLKLHQMKREIGENGQPRGLYTCRLVGCGWRGIESTALFEFRKHLALVINDAITHEYHCSKNGYHATPHNNCYIFNDGV